MKSYLLDSECLIGTTDCIREQANDTTRNAPINKWYNDKQKFAADGSTGFFWLHVFINHKTVIVGVV